jgi:hypothetical protein
MPVAAAMRTLAQEDGQVSLGSKTTQPETDEVPESRSKPPQLIRKIVVHVANVYNEGWILSENRYLEQITFLPLSISAVQKHGFQIIECDFG